MKNTNHEASVLSRMVRLKQPDANKNASAIAGAIQIFLYSRLVSFRILNF